MSQKYPPFLYLEGHNSSIPCNMIDSTTLNTTFIQTGNTCVFANYGIAFNYFTGKPILTAFQAYCEHHDLTNPQAIVDLHFNRPPKSSHPAWPYHQKVLPH